ncbi:recombinase family protein [Nonomuraea basaltis]|nr:recombinase family protein [Nonomuraea basaltis]
MPIAAAPVFRLFRGRSGCLESMLSRRGPGTAAAETSPQVGQSHKLVSKVVLVTLVTASAFDTVRFVDYGYARVSTTAQHLTRQIDTLKAAGIPEELIWSDRRTGATMARDGLEDLLRRVPPHAGHRITVVTLDRLGRNMRECLNLAHELTERGIGLRTLQDQIPVDTSVPCPAADMAIALLAMFAQMERIYMLERVASARAAKEARGLPTGRPSKMTAQQRAAAAAMIASGIKVVDVAAGFGVGLSTLYRALSKQREETQAALLAGDLPEDGEAPEGVG